ncbi:ABC transporter permease [Novimethylophilus kurashikiensis]|uniref:ABC transporter permease n=1 Tax=Novimethylophilus kurashikiensis TaxID=1825523 RepID=A0A2R5F6B0_9PROT|nr:AI-2E family transporter [Novimethylophilus kurashikiensis]GBG13645.1 ABC transporter permease [Novimethylophilus kurashikiensis]
MRDNSTGLSQFFWLIPLAAGLWLLYRLGPILAPFMFGIILAYIFNPIVDWLEKKRVPRSVGAVLALLMLISTFAGLALIIAPLIRSELQQFIAHLPGYLDSIKKNAAPWLHTRFGIDVALDADEFKTYLTGHLSNAKDLAVGLLPSIKSGSLVVVGLATNLLLVPVVFFYVLRDWNSLMIRVESLLPRRWHALTTQIGREIDTVLSEFLRGQLSVMLVMSIYYVTALHFAGLEFALPIGLVAGMLVFIPYLGFAVGLTLGMLATLMQFQGFSGVLPVAIAFGIGQSLEAMVVTPFLVGERIGLHPVVVIFALLAFGELFGFFGILLALPVSATLLVGLRHVRSHYLDSEFYQN